MQCFDTMPKIKVDFGHYNEKSQHITGCATFINSPWKKANGEILNFISSKSSSINCKADNT